MPTSRFIHAFVIASCLCVSTVRVAAHGGYDEEIARTDEQIAAEPNNGQHWYHRSYLNFLHGEWQQAMMDAEKTERLSPSKFPVDWVRGQALMLGGQLEAALTVITDFIHAHPGHPGGLAVRARILMKMGKVEPALADFRESLAKMPQAEPDLYLEVVEALNQAHHVDEAVQVLQAGIAKLGDIPGLVMRALELETATGQFDAALRRVDAMQKTAPRPEPWMAKRAALLAQAGRIPESLAAWTALRDRIAALPNLERGSNAMSQLTRQAQQALAPSPSSAFNTPAHGPRP